MKRVTCDTWEVNIPSKFQVPSSHADTQLLSDKGDTCSTLSTWLNIQKNYRKRRSHLSM